MFESRSYPSKKAEEKEFHQELSKKIEKDDKKGKTIAKNGGCET